MSVSVAADRSLSTRVLITGASGFVGSNLARRALRDGHDVHLLLRPGYDGWRLHGLDEATVVHVVDLEDRPAVHDAVAAIRPEWVFHLAAYGAYSTETTLERMVSTNVLGCANLLDACVNAGVGAFINAGSSSEYGYTDRAAREDDALQPNSHYAITKAAATHYCQFAARAKDVNAITVRLYSVYGPFEEPSRFFPALIVHGLHGQLPPLVAAETARDFIYVDDAVDAMVTLAAAPSVPRGAIYNVCTGIQTRIADVVTEARRQMNIRAEPAWAGMPRRSWDTSTWVGSPAKLEREVGWRASADVATGLRKTLRWFEQNPEQLPFYEQHISTLPVRA